VRELQSLLERVKAASGPDRELDRAFDRRDIFPVYGDHPQYTASIDAALGLVEKVLPGWALHSLQDMRGERYVVCALRNDRNEPGTDLQRTWCDGKTRPLAILAAFLTVLIAEQPK
jgi:hypothetical protein